jgi:hypothetical protein
MIISNSGNPMFPNILFYSEEDIGNIAFRPR